MNEKVADTYLAEFTSLREEIFNRFESQRQAFNYMMALFGLLVAIFVGYLDKQDLNNIEQYRKYIMLLPVISSPFGFIFFDNEIFIWSIGDYIDKVLRPKLTSATGEKVLLIERHHSCYLTGKRGLLHLCLSAGRWLFFLLPVAFPTAYACFIRNEILKEPLFGIPVWVLLIFNILLGALLLLAIIASIRIRLKSWSSCQST